MMRHSGEKTTGENERRKREVETSGEEMRIKKEGSGENRRKKN